MALEKFLVLDLLDLSNQIIDTLGDILPTLIQVANLGFERKHFLIAKHDLFAERSIINQKFTVTCNEFADRRFESINIDLRSLRNDASPCAATMMSRTMNCVKAISATCNTPQARKIF